MEDRYNVWICMSDLLAGIMAFFIFVSAGLYADYAGLEGLAFGELMAEPRATSPGTNQFNLPDYEDSHVSMQGNAVYFGKGYFARGSYTLNKDIDLSYIIDNINRAVAENQGAVKILIAGHTSCSFDVDNTDWAAIVPHWASLTEVEQQKEIRQVATRYNSELAFNRAFTIYTHLLANAEAIKANGLENIQFISMSERMAAAQQGNLICQDRRINSENPDSRSAQVMLVREWPATYDIRNLETAPPYSPRN